MIPNVCHFIWIGPTLPTWAQKNLDSFTQHNPNIEVRLHTDDALLDGLYRARWDQAEHPATRSDMLRYSILERFGGIYFDIDWFHLNPLPMPVDDGKLQCVHMHPGRPVNSAMACRPGLPIFQKLRKSMVARRPAYMTGSLSLASVHRRGASAFAALNGMWCASALQSIGIYCQAHDIALPKMELGDWRRYTAVHLSSCGAVAEADHALRAKRMYIHFKACEHLIRNG